MIGNAKTCSRRTEVHLQRLEKLKTLTNIEWKEMYQFYLKIGKINEKVYTIFI